MTLNILCEKREPRKRRRKRKKNKLQNHTIKKTYIYIYIEARRSRISPTDGMVSFGYILATNWAKLSYLSRNSFCSHQNDRCHIIKRIIAYAKCQLHYLFNSALDYLLKCMQVSWRTHIRSCIDYSTQTI